MKKAHAPVSFSAVLCLVAALTVPAAGQTQTSGQTPAGQTQTGAQTPVVPGAEQPAGSPVLTAPTPVQTFPPARTFGDVNGIGSQVSTPYTLSAPARPGRPNRGVFGVAPANIEPQLTLEALFGGGMSGNPVASQTVGAPGGGLGNAEGGSGAGTGSANLVYSYNKPRFSIDASNIVSADYYKQYEDNKFQPRDIATFAVNFVPASNTRVTVSQGYKNLPEFSFSELLDADIGLTVPLNQDLAITVDRYARYGTSLDVTQKLSRRSSIDGSVGYAYGVLTSGSHWTTLSFTGSFNQSLGKGLGVYAGYVYGQQVFQGSDGRSSKDRHPTIRLGVDFNRALSIARRTTIGFSTGVAQLQDRVQNQTLYQIIGGASLKREFGRTWDAAVSYARNARLIEALDQPLFTDSLSVVTQGTFTRRIQLKVGIGASAGQYGSRSGSGFDTYFGSAQLAVGLTRNFALGADYAYQRLSNPPGALPIVASGLYSQQSARAYFKIWTPVLSRPRKS